MKRLALILALFCALCFQSNAATVGFKVSDFPRIAAVPTNGLVLIAVPATNGTNGTNYSIWGSNLFSQILSGTNGITASNNYVTTTSLTNYINVLNSSTYFFWTNMVTNVVVNLTNVASLTGARTLNFFFTGGISNYTATFLFPNDATTTNRWGINSATNGGTGITVSNNHAVGVSMTLWNSNTVESYFQHLR